MSPSSLRLILLCLPLLSLLTAPQAQAEPSAPIEPPARSAATTPAKLTPTDQADIARVETYLNNLKSIAADFMQIDDAGGVMRGKISIQRPGKMRVVYEAPNKDFIVADGGMVHIWNDDLKSQTNVDQSGSLAEFILRDPIKLEGEVTVTKFQRYPAKLELTLVQANDPAAGQLTLIFEDKPLQLRQWRVLDPQGSMTGVNLENAREGVSFPPGTFSFMPPNFGKGGKAQ
ncbi:MAG: outer membrane lipoprotein carrier protein LolA [Bdellovibrionales bacterium]